MNVQQTTPLKQREGLFVSRETIKGAYLERRIVSRETTRYLHCRQIVSRETNQHQPAAPNVSRETLFFAILRYNMNGKN